jgi:hypothetical protein
MIAGVRAARPDPRNDHGASEADGDPATINRGQPLFDVWSHVLP